MAHAYAAMFALVRDFELEREDPEPDLEGMASPQIDRLSWRLDLDFIERCKAQVEDAYLEDYMDDSPEEAEACRRRLRWEIAQRWTEHEAPRRSDMVLDLYEEEEMAAKLVVQQVEMEE